MQPFHRPDRVIEFGPFVLEPETGVLRKHGIRIKLQAQPLQVLIALLENPGSVVTREDLRRRLWPDNFVDFDHCLNAAVNRLRHALGDSVTHPRYLETLTKNGYRFIGIASSPAPAATNQSPLEPHSGRSQPARNVGTLILMTAAALLGVMIAAAYLGGSRGPVLLSPPVPLTVYQGSEVDPALSPDGKHVAFAWNGERQDNFDIYILTIASGEVRRLTADSAHDLSPAWSPDGRTIAFLRRLGGDRAALLLVPAAGGREQLIRETRNDEMRGHPRLAALSWSPDGRWIAVSHREPGEPHEGIYLLSMNGETRRLTNSPADSHGDHAPAFSPDGRKLAFSRLLGFSNSEIYVLSLDANRQATGEVRLTDHKRWSSNPVWTGGGERILYLFGQSGNLRMHRELRMIASSGMPSSDRAIPLGDNLWQISAGRRLIYSQREDTNIWRAGIAPPGEPLEAPSC